MKAYSLTFILVLLSLSKGISQGQIISVMPSSGAPGKEYELIIQGAGTNFESGKTNVHLGEGVDILRVDVRTRETLVARVRISPAASDGPRTVTVSSSTGISWTGTDLFEVFSLGTNVTATIDVIPVQTVYLSDFDPNNLQRSPLLFTVSVFNDMQVHNLRAELSISGDYYGEIATGVKVLNNIQPGAVIRFDNRQFDSYKMASGGNNFTQAAFQSGTFPADLYTYTLRIFENGILITDAEGKNPIVNQVAKPELISPGNDMSITPEAMRSKLPLLQWFSQLPTVNVSIYPVFNGQSSPEEIVQNRPVWRQENVTQSSLLYPASAEALEEGQVYAWQIVGVQQGSRGTEYFPSEVFWFKVQNSAPGMTQLAEIMVEPQEITVTTGQTQQFTAKGFDDDKQELKIQPMWKVVPSDAGSIDANGVFTAGQQAKIAAIVADFEGFEDYSTITIRIPMKTAEEWAMDKFLRELFGVDK